MNGTAIHDKQPALGFHHRSSGVLLHLTSLPGPHGSGDLGREAHRFVDCLAHAGQTWWQVLPVVPPAPAPGFSPYDPPSAFAGSPWLVSLQRLWDRGWLEPAHLRPTAGLRLRTVNFPVIQGFRDRRLRAAYERFRERRGDRERDFVKFCDAHADWLEDFALFMALRRETGGRPWTDWESGVRTRDPAALQAARARLSKEIAVQRFVQFEFDRQWRALRAHAHRRRVGLIGDLPIFVGHDSADVWSHPELFQLDHGGHPRFVSGYPPDAFNRQGQRWGHPQYAWRAHARTRFAWWRRRFARMFELFDAVRIDHFLGFTRTWSIPTAAPTAHGGRWVPAPGPELFCAIEHDLGRASMIAEDLGHVTPADIRLRDRFGLAPMRLLQFGFGSGADAGAHLPHNYTRLTAAYTGTHDHDTWVGWFSALPPGQRHRVLSYTGASASAPHAGALRALLASPANVVILPMQDVLGLDSRARMNRPGTLEGNWAWRLTSLHHAPALRQLASLTKMFDRTAKHDRGSAPPA